MTTPKTARLMPRNGWKRDNQRRLNAGTTSGMWRLGPLAIAWTWPNGVRRPVDIYLRDV